MDGSEHGDASLPGSAVLALSNARPTQCRIFKTDSSNYLVRTNHTLIGESVS